MYFSKCITFKGNSDKTQAQHIAVGGYVSGWLQQVAKAKDTETIAFFDIGNDLE